MTKEEVVQEIKNCVVDCMSLIDTENVEGCIDRMLNLCNKLKVNNLYGLTNKIINKSDVRVQKLNDLVDYIETTARYTEDTGSDSTEALENYIDHIAEVEMLDEMDRCYILTEITRNKHVTCYAGQIVARGLFKSIEW